MNTFIKGLIIGISMAAPIGPISLLCIRRSLAGGHAAGLATALGVACADGLYALIAALGLTALSTFLINQRDYLYVFGGIFLIIFGYKVYTAPPVHLAKPIKSKGFLVTLLQTTLLTLTNPMTIAAFIAAFAAVGFNEAPHGTTEAVLISFGVFCGSGLWFICLSSVLAHIRTRVTPTILDRINKVSGIAIICFGAIFILTVLKNILFS